MIVTLRVDGDEDVIRRWFAEVLAGYGQIDPPFQIDHVRVRRARFAIMHDRPEALDPKLATEIPLDLEEFPSRPERAGGEIQTPEGNNHTRKAGS